MADERPDSNRKSAPEPKPEKRESAEGGRSKDKDKGLLKAAGFGVEICGTGAVSSMGPGPTKAKKELALCKTLGQDGVKIRSYSGVETGTTLGLGKCGPLVGSASIKVDMEKQKAAAPGANPVSAKGEQSVTLSGPVGYVKFEISPQGDLKSVEVGARGGCAGAFVEYSRAGGAQLEVPTHPQQEESDLNLRKR